MSTEAIIAAADEHLRAGGRLLRSVRDARRAGVTWEAIGKALGVTKQAAEQRFGPYCDRSD